MDTSFSFVRSCPNTIGLHSSVSYFTLSVSQYLKQLYGIVQRNNQDRDGPRSPFRARGSSASKSNPISEHPCQIPTNYIREQIQNICNKLHRLRELWYILRNSSFIVEIVLEILLPGSTWVFSFSCFPIPKKRKFIPFAWPQ